MHRVSLDKLESTMRKGGAGEALGYLADTFAQTGQYPALFEVRLMQVRHRLGLPVAATVELEELAEPIRSQVEEAYLAACREVGRHLLERSDYRLAWMYLRVPAEKAMVRQALASATISDENREDLIDLALNEGVAPALGLQWVLEHYGTCNAITMFESVLRGYPLGEQRDAAALLVRRLYDEVSANVKAHIERTEGRPPQETPLSEQFAGREWLFADGNYHVDPSHLASVVRIARLADDPAILRLALQLADYGCRLSRPLQYPGEPPFADVYAAHRLWFSALLGERQDEAREYFHSQVSQDPDDPSAGPTAETYLLLLTQLGRYREAFDFWAGSSLLARQLSDPIPPAWELARRCGCLDRYLEICRRGGDWLGYIKGRTVEQSGEPSAESLKE
jgi:hypothetical protein